MARLGLGVLQDFTKLRLDSQAKNITAWTPVVAEILQGFAKFDDRAVSRVSPANRSTTRELTQFPQFARYLPAIYPLATELLSREMAPEIRQNLRDYFLRVGYIQGIIERS